LKNLIRILLTILICIATGCILDHPTIPNVPVNFYIYPNEVSAINLNNYGGHEYFTGGVSGVVVYRLGEGEFTAFDRACPFDWEDSLSWIWVEPDGITLKCQKCGSVFNILDGGVITGPSKFQLKQYFTKYDGWRLRVHS